VRPVGEASWGRGWDSCFREGRGQVTCPFDLMCGRQWRMMNTGPLIESRIRRCRCITDISADNLSSRVGSGMVGGLGVVGGPTLVVSVGCYGVWTVATLRCPVRPPSCPWSAVICLFPSLTVLQQAGFELHVSRFDCNFG